MIQYINEDIQLPGFDRPKVTRWLKEIAASYHKKLGNIAYIFCSDERILEVNKQYLNHDYYTDIITFDYVRGKIISADIFVSLPRISENAIQHFKSFNLEFHRVLAHGILHLCGYKDKTDSEILVMRKKEDFYLKLL